MATRVGPYGAHAGEAVRTPHPAPADAATRWASALPALGDIPRMWVPLAAALGRVIADEVRPCRPSPWFACAAMDGLAVYSGDLDGEPPHILPAGYVDVVDTGDAIPGRYDAVIPVEEVSWRGEHVVLDGPVVPGATSVGSVRTYQRGRSCCRPGIAYGRSTWRRARRPGTPRCW
jgi:molybdopterin biosynthesis enzyme